MAQRTVRLGIIGIGWYAATDLIPQLRATGRVEIVAISRRSADRLALAQQELNVPDAFTDWREMLDQSVLAGSRATVSTRQFWNERSVRLTRYNASFEVVTHFSSAEAFLWLKTLRIYHYNESSGDPSAGLRKTFRTFGG